jgi:sulfopyruvate decarboxylase TPP-binding subunit
VPLTTEEEGVALLAGAWLGGERGVLLMQSSGVGNCINMLSLTQACRFPLTMLVAMRGEWGEFNPWQVPMGTHTQAALELCNVVVYRVDRAEEELAGNGSPPSTAASPASTSQNWPPPALGARPAIVVQGGMR